MSKRIIVFNSTHQALKTEERLREHDIGFEVVPLPKEISAGCGLAIEIAENDLEEAQVLIKRYRIAVKGVYEL